MNISRPHNRLGGAVLLLLALAACGRQGPETSGALPPPPPPVTSSVPQTSTTTTSTTAVPETTTTTAAPVPPAAPTTAAPVPFAAPTTAAPRPRPSTTVVTQPVEPEPSTTTTTTTAAPPPEPSRVVTSHGGPVRDHVSLVDNLRARGLTVTPLEPVVQPFLRGDGTVLAVSGAGIGPAQVQSFQYDSPESAAADVATLTPECNPGMTSIMWMGPPHFYRAGRVLVIYVGSDTALTGLLTELVGPQVCGG